MDVSQSFRRIEAWVAQNAPEVGEKLQPGATAGEIDEAEAALGVRMPPSVRAAYLLHDGESKASDGLFGLWRWLPLDEVVEQDREMIDIEREYNFGDYTPGLMIPLMEDGGGNMLYVETSADGGETPVIDWDHEAPTRDVQHPSFAAMLSAFADRLERGDFVFRPGDLMGLIDRSELGDE